MLGSPGGLGGVAGPSGTDRAADHGGDRGWARHTVQAWVRRYDEDGLAGLWDRSGRGRPPILSPEEQPAVAQRLAEGPQEAEVCPLRGVDFPPFVQDQFGKRMSLSCPNLKRKAAAFEPQPQDGLHPGFAPFPLSATSQKSNRAT